MVIRVQLRLTVQHIPYDLIESLIFCVDCIPLSFSRCIVCHVVGFLFGQRREDQFTLSCLLLLPGLVVAVVPVPVLISLRALLVCLKLFSLLVGVFLLTVYFSTLLSMIFYLVHLLNT